jgi:hypothetical protein
MAGLALDAEIGLLAIGAGGLVDRAYGSGAGAEQVDRALQDSLEQRLQGELTSEVLDGARERMDRIAGAQVGDRLCTSTISASRSPCLVVHVASASEPDGERSGSIATVAYGRLEPEPLRS